MTLLRKKRPVWVGLSGSLPIPAAPTLTAPADASIGTDTTPEFTWNAVTGATLYHIQISTVSNFTSTVVDDATLATNSYTPSALTVGTLYYWRVAGINANGTQGAWSSTRTFTLYAVYDTFTAADGTNLHNRAPDLAPGANKWVVLDGSYSIQSNKALAGAIGGAVIDSGLANCIISVVCTTGNTTGSMLTEIFVRSLDADDGWLVVLNVVSQLFVLFEYVAGVATQRASAAAVLAANTAYTVAITLNGQTISATINGGNQISYGSAASNATVTKHGVRAVETGTVTTRSSFDTFSVRPL